MDKSFDEIIEELVAFADNNGTRDDGSLDGMVHDVASSIASNVNNGGLEEQIKFILTHNGPTEDNINEIKSILSE